jgi:sugar phosphate isomerase/epimerase
MLMGVPRALNLAGISFAAPAAPPATDARARIEWAASLGVRALQLDATAPDLRPRELDRSARRDVASLLRRLEVGFAGLDCSIPPGHFADPAHVDRAVKATCEALTLAADLAALVPAPGSLGTVDSRAGRVVAVTLAAAMSPDVRQTLAHHALACHCTLVDFRWPLPGLDDSNRSGAAPFSAIGSASASMHHAPGMGMGLDTGTLLAAGLDPAKFISRLATRFPGEPTQLRLSDVAASRRVPIGEGELDELTVDVACQVAGYRGFAIIDLRGIPAADQVVPRLWSA